MSENFNQETQVLETQQSKKNSLWGVISGASLGMVIEYFDFYIFGSLAVILSTKFFPAENPTVSFLSTLATFAAGFVVRPFGALFFGRLGDLVGRKYTFIVTLILMGGSTFLIGCIPSYETIGMFAPLLVLILRLLQGLALGGEYGGSATFVAEHTTEKNRGFWTSWLQTTATLGLILSLIVIMLTKLSMSAEQFDDWGWRVPFWFSIIFALISLLKRKNMKESPVFEKAKKEGKTSSNPIKESFGNKYNFKWVLLALFGAAMGQGVIWYTGQFYAMNFMQKTMNLDGFQVDKIMTIALSLSIPLFIFFGWLSDKLGRKYIMLAGMLLAVFGYRPIYEKMYQQTNISDKKITHEKTQQIRMAKADAKTLGDSLITFTKMQEFTDGTILKQDSIVVKKSVETTEITPAKINKSIKVNSEAEWILIASVFIQMFFLALVYGPIAAFLVELFPAKIRYTSMSLPYHIGNGIFGGLVPTISIYIVSFYKDKGVSDFYLQGLWYPIIVVAVCFVIGLIYIDKKPRDFKEQ
ncbi:MAG: MFS transporter [Flavobacteriaceae bacterium]|nr:MFS transporter [Flavobacteriaceae bacterium]